MTVDGGGTVGLDSVKLTVPSSQRHDGTENSGVKIQTTGSGLHSFLIKRSQFTVEWLELDLSSAAASVGSGFNFGANSQQDVYIKNNLLHDLVTQSNHIHGIYVWHANGDASNTRYLMNNVIYNIDNSSTTKEAAGITVPTGNWGVYLYGNTGYHVKATGSGDDAFCFDIYDTDTFIKNNIAARPDNSGSFIAI